MLQKMRVLLLVCITAVLAACGGGGGGDDTPNFAARYFESFTIVSNTCGSSIGSKFEAADTVTQSGRSVSINSDGLLLSGTVDADNGGFSTAGSGVYQGINVQASIKYRTITTGSKYSVEFNLSGNGCNIVATGTATKT